MSDTQETTWIQKTLQTVSTGLLLAAILGIIGVRDTANRDSIRLDNFYIALGEIQKDNQESRKDRIKMAEAMAVIATAQATMTYRIATAEAQCKELEEELKQYNGRVRK